MNHAIEIDEMRAESAYNEAIQLDGQMKCHCGQLFDPEREGGTISPDPYAMPVCEQCLDGCLSQQPQTNEDQ